MALKCTARCVWVLAALMIIVPAARAQATSTTPAPRNPAEASGVIQPTKLIHSVAPKYPKDAKAAHVEGTVVLKVKITKEGTVTDVEFVSGPDALKDAAIAAVQKWKYEPMKFKGKPMDTDTKISVVFSLH